MAVRPVLKNFVGTLPLAGIVTKENYLRELTVDYKNQLFALLACLKSVVILATTAGPSRIFQSNILFILLYTYFYTV